MNERQFLITEDGSHTLFLPELNETYHSVRGAIQESNYVFIEQGLKYYLDENKPGKIEVFEVGFGTGLNALLSALFAKKHRISMVYSSIESFPLNYDEIQKLNYIDLINDAAAPELFGKIHEAEWDANIGIGSGMEIRKIKDTIQDHHFINEFNICFFDAFAPSKQPEMWERDILRKMFEALKKGGVFVTYCAKGQLKRDLRSIGFQVQSLPGPPGKMEMVRGIKV